MSVQFICILPWRNWLLFTKMKNSIRHAVIYWENMTQKRMYITGGIGSTVDGEAFTIDYDLAE